MKRPLTYALIVLSMIVALATGFGAAKAGHTIYSNFSTAEPTADVVVLIKRDDGLGSGFHIGNGIIVTAAHVVGDAATVGIKTSDGNETRAHVLATDAATDVAILYTPHAMASAPMDCRDPVVGETIMTIGSPLGLEFITTYGRVAGTARRIGELDYYVTDMTTVMGQSGSAVFAGGKVIGVISAVMTAPIELMGNTPKGVYSRSVIGFGFVVPATVVCAMLEREGL